MSFASTRRVHALSLGCLALLAVGLVAGCGGKNKNKSRAPNAKTSTPPSSDQTANVVPGTPVDSSYVNDLSDAVDVSSVVACGSGTDGLGACTSDNAFLIVCSGGKAYAFDCSQVASGASCLQDSDTNLLGCGSSQ